MKPHPLHCPCAAYARGVLYNLRHVGCACGANPVDPETGRPEPCETCLVVGRALRRLDQRRARTARGGGRR